MALWLVAALDARGQPGSAFVQGTILTPSDHGVRQAFGFEPAPSAARGAAQDLGAEYGVQNQSVVGKLNTVRWSAVVLVSHRCLLTGKWRLSNFHIRVEKTATKKML